MADRVHPRSDSPHIAGTSSNPPEKSESGDGETLPSFNPKPQPPPGTYVIQVPKDQIYRVPPPGNARRFQTLTRAKNRRSRCCCCCCCSYIFLILLFLLVAAGVVAGVFYLTVRPKAPSYSVESISIKGFNISSSDLTVSPEFDVVVRAENPNKKIGIYYGRKSSVTVSHSGSVELCRGVLPSFYQGTKNVTVFTAVLTGTGVHLSSGVQETMRLEQERGNVPLVLDLKVPVRVRVWGMKSWNVKVKVKCHVSVNKLEMNSKVISKKCKVDVNPW